MRFNAARITDTTDCWLLKLLPNGEFVKFNLRTSFPVCRSAGDV